MALRQKRWWALAVGAWMIAGCGGAGSTEALPEIEAPPETPTGGSVVVSAAQLNAPALVAGESLAATVTVANGTAAEVTLSELAIRARPQGGGEAQDFAPRALALTLAPGTSHTLQASFTFPEDSAGAWEVFAAFEDAAAGWSEGPSAPLTVSPPPEPPAPPPPPPPSGSLAVSAPQLSSAALVAGQSLQASVTWRNDTSAVVTLSQLTIAARPAGRSGPGEAFAPQAASATLAPGESQTLKASYAFPADAEPGDWEVFGTFQDGASAAKEGPATRFAVSASPKPPPGELVASSVKLSAAKLTAGQTLTGTVTYTNETAAPVTLTNLVITAREPGTTHASGPYYNFSPSPASVTVPPGATHTLQASYTFATSAPAGTWEVFSTYQDGAQTWHDGPSSSFTMVAAPPTTPPPTSGRFPVIGYYPDWSGSVSAIPFQHLTHINYSFILPTASGGLNQTIDANRLRSLVDLAQPKGIKVLIAVGGWNNGNDSAFESLSGNATARAAFVNNIASFITTHRLDGVDIDWEYPDAGQSGANFALLIRDLAAKLHPMGKLVTAAVGPSHVAGNIPTSTYADLDLVNIMAYDCGNCGGQNSPYSMAEDLLGVYLNRGVPRSKAILGLPFYSSNATVNETIQKTKLAMAQGGGVMIWEVSMSPTATLLQAISDTVAGKN